jgi:hypothetical protein
LIMCGSIATILSDRPNSHKRGGELARPNAELYGTCQQRTLTF